MTADRSSAGDPARTLELLWRHHDGAAAPDGERRRPGPRPGLSVDAVVRAGTALADTAGLAALSMRRLAADLGASPMTLYTYVPGRAELLDLMLDEAYARMERRPAGRGWRQRATAVAEDNRALHRRHPWTVEVATTRPTLGPGQTGKYEHELAALAALGLDDVGTDAALTFLLGFVQTCARAEVDARAAAQESAMSDEAWWQQNAPLLARVLDPATYPLATRVGAAAGQAHGGAYDPDAAWEFGLARVLDGLAALRRGR